LNKRNENNRRDDDVKREERADAAREKIANENGHVERVMLHDPRNELRIRQKQPEQTEDEIEIPKFHGRDFFQEICKPV